MAFLTYTQNPIGSFVEKECGNTFEYSKNDDAYNIHICEDMPHKIWVASHPIGGDSGFRYGHVRKTVVAVVVDEDEYGLPVIEKWQIKKHRVYDNTIVDMIDASRLSFLKKL